MPVKNYTHDLILEILKPHATRGWIKRFIAVKNAGPDMWLMLVRDFNIQHQKVEYIVEDIVRALEPPQEENSLVRKEMEQLSAQGKLDLSTPELEAEWQKQLDEESDKLAEWKAVDKIAREKQREADLLFLKNKKNPVDMVIPMKNQDPRNEGFTVKSIKVPPGHSETVETPTGTEVIKEHTPITPSVPAPPQVASPPAPAPVAPQPTTEHAKELSDVEKAQIAFVPKPPPDKEPEYKDPKIVAIDGIADDGKIIPAYRAPESVETINGLSQEGIERLKKNGISTVTAFESMGHEQAKSILGMPAYQSIKNKLKT